MQKTRIALAVLISASFLVLACGGPAIAETLSPAEIKAKPLPVEGSVKTEDQEYIEDEIIVKYKGDVKPFRVVKVPEGEVGVKIKEFSRKENVEYAEPNYIAHAQMIPNDPLYPSQWHFHDGSGGINMEGAWNITRGNNIIIAVLDTGIAYEDYGSWFFGYEQAPDLADTCFVPGYDFINIDSHPNDDNTDGHGTHVAGTIAQNTNNNLGVAGIAFDACLMPVKVLNQQGTGTYTQVADGIRFAVDNGAHIINLSLAGRSASATLEDAVAYAYNNGVTVVAAAGNDSSSTISYPAAYNDYVIAVGATRYDETLSYYSNYGQGLDVVAPGGDTRVDQNNDGNPDGIRQQTFKKPYWWSSYEWDYYYYQGTSMATPHVAGVAALLISNGNATTPSQVQSALQETAKDLGTAGWDETYGWGLINAHDVLYWGSGPNHAPVAEDQSVVTDEDVALDITLTASDEDNDPLTYSIVSEPANGTLSGQAPNVTYTPDENYNGSDAFTFKAYDGRIDSNEATVSITINSINDAPQADAGSDKTALIEEEVTFDGSDSTDPDGNDDIVAYEWDFGDNITDNGMAVTHAYAEAGNYTVTLTVRDNAGETATDTAKIEVSESTLPTMHIGDITFTYDKFGFPGWGSWCKVSASVPVLDSSDNGVKGAVVEGSWSGAHNEDVSSTTNYQGTAFSQTPYIMGCGTFTFTVNDIVKDGWSYNSATNIETSDSITINP